MADEPRDRSGQPRAASVSLDAGAPAPAVPSAPRGLRLSTILIELGARAEPAPPDEQPAPTSLEELEASLPQNISRRRRRKLRRQLRKSIRSNITLGEVIDRTAHAGFGFLAAFLALVSLPFVGLSTPFGLAVALLGAQMVAGRNQPWLPKRIRKYVLTMNALDWLSQRVARWTRGVERLIRPRYVFLLRRPLWTLIGLGIVIQGVGLALPIPIPGSNWLFAVPITLYAIGLLEDDGLLVALAHILTAIQVVLAVLFSDVVVESIARVAHWIGSIF